MKTLRSWFCGLAGLGLLVSPVCAQTVDQFNPGTSAMSTYAIAYQPDGKVLFGTSNGTVQLIRLNADGTRDTAFAPAVAGNVNAIATLSSGQILVGGAFTTVGGQTRNYLARLNANGTLDTTFNPNPNGVVNAILVLPNGNVVLGGAFTTVGGLTHNSIAQVSAAGAVSTTFNPNVTPRGGVNGGIFTLGLQADGKILLGGNFTDVGGVARLNLARVAADGTLETGFNPNPVYQTSPNIQSPITCLLVQADGKILVMGNYDQIGGRSNLGGYNRLNSDGTYDPTFNVASSINGVNSMVQQANGSIFVGGSFAALGASNPPYLSRLADSGAFDPTFRPFPSTDNTVRALAIQPDGKVIMTGAFNSPGLYSARLNNNVAPSSMVTITAPNQLDWTRGGSSPEVNQVAFERYTGTAWASLGNATRIAGGWRLSGVTLPSYQIRAVGRTTSGYQNRSSSVVVETVVNAQAQVEQPAGTIVPNGTGRDLGYSLDGAAGNTLEFLLLNTGATPLTISSITIDGANAANFSIVSVPATTLAQGASTSVMISFASPTSGAKTARLRIVSNSANPAYATYDVPLTGRALSSNDDTDGDGMNDVAEYRLAALGFDWQVAQPALVSTFYNNAPSAGLYTAAQVQDLNVGVPLIQRDSAGVFTLTIGVQRSADLATAPFADFPLNTPGTTTSINAAGKLEFQFTVPNGAAFFRLHAP